MTGIPRIIHQTWKDESPPPGPGSPDSWRRLNPGWDYRFWTDRGLRDFVAADFPELLALYDSYPNPVQRADLGRYCLLSRFGGVYADIDTTCVAPLEPLAGDTRVVLSREPAGHAVLHASARGLPTMYFNGTMASPAGHPFWREVIGLCQIMAPHARRDVLESTGPLLLTGAVVRWHDQESLALNSCHLFTPLLASGETSDEPEDGPFGGLRLSVHHWQGSWYSTAKRSLWKRAILTPIRKAVHYARRGPALTLAQARAAIDGDHLASPLPAAAQPPKVAVFVPVRNGAPFLETNFEQILGLDYPKERLRIVYGEGGSDDDSVQIIARIAERSAETGLAGVVRVDTGPGIDLPRNRRWKPAYQYRRRSALARVRNRMIEQGLRPDDDWVLWLDVDVCGVPPGTLARLLEEREKIVAPNCVLEDGGRSYDLNCFLEISTPDAYGYYRHVRGGLLQPPVDYWYRRHLDGLRYLDRVPLHGVGGCMLLVQADLHRAGLRFPEKPYRDMLETEAFGLLARDLGIVPIGLPNVEIRHVRS